MCTVKSNRDMYFQELSQRGNKKEKEKMLVKIKEQHELSKCTFVPKINKSSSSFILQPKQGENRDLIH